MHSLMKRMALAAWIMSAALSANADPMLQRADSLLNAPATVISVNAVTQTVVLRVRSTGRDSKVFTISQSCLFSGGLQSIDNLFPNERVMIWTQSGQTGKLPLIYRVERAQN